MNSNDRRPPSTDRLLSDHFVARATHVPNSFQWETVDVESVGHRNNPKITQTPLDALGLTLGRMYASCPSYRSVVPRDEPAGYQRWPFARWERYVPVKLTLRPMTEDGQWNAEIVMGLDGRLSLYFEDQSWVSFKTHALENLPIDTATIIRPGVTFFGDRTDEVYVAGEQIGQGGTAHVYRVYREDGDLAAKCISPGRFSVQELTERFSREVDHLEAVRHPNIVSFVDRAYHGECLILVMESAVESLAQRLSRSRPQIPTAVDWVDQILAGAEHLHVAGLVHRDLTPKNVLVDADGVLKISDFGTVRAPMDVDITTAGDIALGSLIYISDEQRRSPHNAEPADDVFAIGQIAYLLLTGLLPVANPPPLVDFAHIPAPVAAAVDEMRRYRRDDRIQTASAARRRWREAARAALVTENPEPSHESA